MIELTEPQFYLLRQIQEDEEKSGHAYVYPPSGTHKKSLEVLIEHRFLFCKDEDCKGNKSRYCITTKGKNHLNEVDRRKY